ncbi:hypothetical protein EV363DRAFT_1218591, partial [Boletus edulis]
MTSATLSFNRSLMSSPLRVHQPFSNLADLPSLHSTSSSPTHARAPSATSLTIQTTVVSTAPKNLFGRPSCPMRNCSASLTTFRSTPVKRKSGPRNLNLGDETRELTVIGYERQPAIPVLKSFPDGSLADLTNGLGPRLVYCGYTNSREDAKQRGCSVFHPRRPPCRSETQFFPNAAQVWMKCHQLLAVACSVSEMTSCDSASPDLYIMSNPPCRSEWPWQQCTPGVS